MAKNPAPAADPTPEADDEASEATSTMQRPSGEPEELNPSDAKLFQPGSTPDMPAVQQHALDAARAKKQAAAASPAGAGVKDTEGRPFNPAWHVVGPDGGPVLNKDGTCRKTGGRGAPKATGKGPAVNGASQSRLDTGPSNSGPSVADEEATKKAMEVKATATLCASLTFRISVMLGGEDFKPDPGEPEAMTEGYEAVLVRYGVSDLPPLAALVAIMFVYASKRWNAPKVVERRKSLREWFAHKWIAWRFKKDTDKTKATRDAHKVTEATVDGEVFANQLAMGAPAAH